MRTVLALLGLLLVVVPAWSEELPDCIRNRCELNMKTPEGGVLACGKVRIWKNDHGQKWAMVRYPCPYLPPATPTPVPTRAASPCVTNPASFCWAPGARLNPAGGCFASCTCVQRAPGACAE